MTFQSVSGVIPDPETELGGRQIGRFLGPSNNNSRVPETDSRYPEIETGSLETEKRVRRIHGTLGKRVYTRMPRSLVAPTRDILPANIAIFAFIGFRDTFRAYWIPS